MGDDAVTSNLGGSVGHNENGDANSKGKDKAVKDTAQDISMDEDDDEDSSEESGVEEQAGEPEVEDEDNMEEIDTDNIISGGRRTRGRNIDFAKAAEEAKDLPEDEDDDGDFEEPKDDNAMEQ